MSDAAQRLLAHPLAVAAHVLGQAVGAGPGPRAVVGVREDGRAAGEARRDLDESLVDEDGDGVEVRGVRLEPEPLGLQRDRSATGEGVEDGGRVVPRRAPDLLADLAEKMLVVDIVPVHHPRDEGEEAPPLGFHSRPGHRLRVALAGGAGRLQEVPVARRRVVDQLGKEDRARRGQGAARPPQVQGGRVPLADGLLPARLPVDLLQGQCDLDELLLRHGRPSGRSVEPGGRVALSAGESTQWAEALRPRPPGRPVRVSLLVRCDA